MVGSMEMVMCGHIGVVSLTPVTVFPWVSVTDCETLEKDHTKVKMAVSVERGKGYGANKGQFITESLNNNYK